MIGTIVVCAFWSCILVIIIQAYTHDDVEFSEVYGVSLTAYVIAGFIAFVATAPMENAALIVATYAVISLITTAVAAHIIYPTDLKTIVKIALTFAAVQIAVVLAIFLTLYVFFPKAISM